MEKNRLLELIDTDFPEVGPITDETLQAIEDHASRCRGSVRMSTGRIWKDKDYEAYRRRVLSQPLP